MGIKTYSERFSCNSGFVERSVKKLFCKIIQGKFKSEPRNIIRFFFSEYTMPSLTAGSLHLVPDHPYCSPSLHHVLMVYTWQSRPELEKNIGLKLKN